MATKYSDFIKMQDFLPVYDMTDETPEMWRTFIPTKQFCELLGRSITAITSKEIGKRRSMWIRGTFGTGKSHASSVVRHLLCDTESEVEDYIQNLPDEALKANLTAIRKQKKYFPVVLKGVEGAYNIPRFSLSIQKQTKLALAAAGHNDIVVRSDFDKALNWVEGHKARIPELLELSDELASEAPTYEKLLARLRVKDIDVFMHLEEVLAADDTYLVSDSISDWLVEVEEKIEATGIADGLIVFWDEFTSVMDTLKSDRINVLQNIAEKSQNNNIFLYLISHRTENSSTDAKGKDITKMSDRYDVVDYQMDEISTYLILRHTFTIPDKAKLAMTAYNVASKLDATLYDFLCETNSPEEREHIHHLFPLHPYTAYLCSRMSNIMGSANRSVLKFMNDEKFGFKAFINDENNYVQQMMLTSDWLWDFFYADFARDPQYTTINSTYSNYIGRVEKMGDDYVRVFKVILLLNALIVRKDGLGIKDKEDDDRQKSKFALDEDSLKRVFSGDRCKDKMETILDWLNDNRIVVRDLFNEYKISMSSYNATEIGQQRMRAKSEYKLAVDYLRFNQSCWDELSRVFLVGDQLVRKCEPQFYSCEEGEAVLRSRLNKYTREKPNHLHVVVLFAITDEQRDMMHNRVKEFSEEFDDCLFILPNQVMTEKTQSLFIDAVAHASVSRSHHNTNEASQYENVAKENIDKWKNRLMGSDSLLFFRGEIHPDGNFSNISNIINRKFSPILFYHGMESVKSILSVQMTFFANKNYKALSLQMLQKLTRDELLAFTGSSIPAKKIFIDGTNNLVNDVCELTEAAKAGNSWLAVVCKEVDHLIAAARKKYADRFSLNEILAPLIRPPYGMFANQANYVVLSYALRKHKDNLFNPSTSQPVGDEKLSEMIVDLFKTWDGGTSEPNKKQLLRFGSAEERNLTSILGEVFNLSQVKGVSMSDLKSLNYAKWSITEFCKQKAQYPLWSLLYCSKTQDSCAKAIKDLISLFNQDSYSLDKIKSVYIEIRDEQVDLYKLLTNPINYKEGFTNFITSIEDVDLQSEWWDELEEELSHMQSEIAFRKEEDVRSRVMSFYINKIKKLEPVVQPMIAAEDPYIPSSVPVIPKTDDIKKAKTLVREQTMPSMMWQKVILDLIEEHPEVSQFLISYLGS